MTGGYAVVGGGAMGTATAWWLAREGRPVTLFEQFEQGHDRGGSHGRSRIFRYAYSDPYYVRLGHEALPLWRELEQAAGTALLTRTGGVDHGPRAALEPIAAGIRDGGARCSWLDPAEAAERWPGMRFGPAVLYQPDAGRIDAAAALRVLAGQAVRSGARLVFGEPVHAVEAAGASALVHTGSGTERFDVVVVAAGAWVTALRGSGEGWPDLPPLRVTQEQPMYFDTAVPDERWPVFLHHLPPDPSVPHAFGRYGLYTPGDGLKVGEHATGPVVDPRHRTEPDPALARRVTDYVAKWLPGVTSGPLRTDSCLYTSTPDERFVLDRRGPLVVCSACSGHGFKFTPAIGRRAARLATGQPVQSISVNPRRGGAVG